MLKVNANGLECWADSLRVGPRTSTYWGTEPLVLLSMFGPRNSVRAAWASLLQAKKYRHLSVGDFNVKLMDDVHYASIQTPMPDRMLHTIILHPLATHQLSPFANGFLQIGSSPEEGYFQRLNRLCPIPLRAEWREELWKAGLQKGLIAPLPGVGIPGYKVSVSKDWADVVKAGILAGDLK